MTVDCHAVFGVNVEQLCIAPVRLAAVQWGGDRRERELGREDLVLAGGEGAREAGV